MHFQIIHLLVVEAERILRGFQKRPQGKKSHSCIQDQTRTTAFPFVECIVGLLETGLIAKQKIIAV